MPYKVTKTPLEGLLVLEPTVFEDDRGFFMESFNQQHFDNAVGKNIKFVQDNHSRSTKGVLRGLHYQINKAQGKLVRVSNGSVFDVVVDIRASSRTFGHWYGIELNDQNNKQLWVPVGFAHGFLVMSDVADFAYKTTEYYVSEFERVIRWDDPKLEIKWPKNQSIILSQKDQCGVSFNDADYFESL